jgi:AcrR family transcriptional regulator
LLDAALRSFASRGFHGTGTRDIAEAAGMSPAAVYVHYRSKEELLFELSLAGHRHVLELVQAAAAGPGGPDERMRELVRGYAEWHAQAHTHARVVQYEMAALEPEHAEQIASIRREVEATVRAVTTSGVESGHFRVTNLAMTALAVLSLGIDVARWYREDGTWTPAEIGEQYADLALRMLTAG